MIYISFSFGAYVVSTSSWNDKVRKVLQREIARDL